MPQTSPSAAGSVTLSPSLAERIGAQLIGRLDTLQGLGSFALITLGVLFTRFNRAARVVHPLIRQQTTRAGVKLMPMFLLLALALGLVIIGQTVALLTKVGAQNLIGTIMVSVVVRELGPILTAMLVMARVGTAVVIELGTARALGEIEALEALGIDPIHYLVVPRVLGLAAAVFSLTVYLILGALGSGYLFAFLQDVALTPADYVRNIAGALWYTDFVLLALKTLGFGAIIGVVTCYFGLARPLRLEDVAEASTRAVVHCVLGCVALDALFIIIYLLVRV